DPGGDALLQMTVGEGCDRDTDVFERGVVGVRVAVHDRGDPVDVRPVVEVVVLLDQLHEPAVGGERVAGLLDLSDLLAPERPHDRADLGRHHRGPRVDAAAGDPATVLGDVQHRLHGLGEVLRIHTTAAGEEVHGAPF